MRYAIIIPARYGSTRFPGKPLVDLGGRSMLQHVYDNAKAASESMRDACSIMVATEDARIQQHCEAHDMDCVMTSDACETGTDRVMEAVSQLDERPDFVLNLQGDAPFTYADIIRKVMDDYANAPDVDIVTPVVQLGWDSLDTLRSNKVATPFSGTTAILDSDRRAIWFSKNILPAIRKEEKWREKLSTSPVYRHIGLYGYRLDALEKYVTFEPTLYEQLEGLEQLRALENGLSIRAVILEEGDQPSMSGIDSPEDLERARKLLA